MIKTRQIVAETCKFVYVWINFLVYSSHIFKTIEFILVKLLSLEWCIFFWGQPVLEKLFIQMHSQLRKRFFFKATTKFLALGTVELIGMIKKFRYRDKDPSERKLGPLIMTVRQAYKLANISMSGPVTQGLNFLDVSRLAVHRYR